MANSIVKPNKKSCSEVEKFMADPLVKWFTSCLKSWNTENISYEDLVDGVLIYNVFLEMDICGQSNDVSPSENNPTKRYCNLATILRKIRQFYEENKGQVILELPNIRSLAREPTSHTREIKLLLCLLLGCAIQCPRMKKYIDDIRQLDETTQAAIMDHLIQITEVPGVVMTREMLISCVDSTTNEENIKDQKTEQEKDLSNIHKAFDKMRLICRERNEYKEKLIRCSIPLSNDDEDSDSGTIDQGSGDSGCWMGGAKKHDAELLEWKAKVRMLKEKEDEMTEDLSELNIRIRKLEEENENLVPEARLAKVYRDELDVVAEQASKAEHLEYELTRVKEKLADLDYYKAREDELLKDIELLTQTKDLLDDKINAYKIKDDTIRELRAQIMELKIEVNDLNLEKAAAREKCMELREQKAEMEHILKTSIKEPLSASFVDEPEESYHFVNNSISEQLSNSMHSKALKLELENRRLSNMVDALKESSAHEDSFKIIDLQNEKRSLSKLVKSLTENLEKMSKKNEEFKSIQERLIEENEKLQSRLKFKELEEVHNISYETVQTYISQEDNDKTLTRKKSTKMSQKQEETQSRISKLENEKDRALHEVEILKKLVNEKFSELESSSRLIQELQFKLQISDKENDFDLAENEQGPKSLIKNKIVKEEDLALEHEQLKEDFNVLIKEFNRIRAKYLEMQRICKRYESEFKEKNARIIELDVLVNKLRNRVEILTQLMEDISREKEFFMHYVSELLKQNHKLTCQTIEDKEFYYNEEKKNTHLVNNLSRLKEKLEEKIMDHYKHMDSHRIKRKRFTASRIKNTFTKVRRAGSELFGRNRRSWAEESNVPSTDKSLDYEYTQASNLSDLTNNTTPEASPADYVNLRDSKNRKSVDFLDNFVSEGFKFEEMKQKYEGNQVLSEEDKSKVKERKNKLKESKIKYDEGKNKLEENMNALKRNNLEEHKIKEQITTEL